MPVRIRSSNQTVTVPVGATRVLQVGKLIQID